MCSKQINKQSASNKQKRSYRTHLPLTKIFLHSIILALAWDIYILFLRKMIIIQYTEFIIICALVIIFTFIITVCTAIWIRYNLNIYKKKGPRTTIRVAEEKYLKDWDGKSINANWAELKEANQIIILIHKTEKKYVRIQKGG